MSVILKWRGGRKACSYNTLVHVLKLKHNCVRRLYSWVISLWKGYPLVLWYQLLH